jgi:hypothetical protein
LKNFLFRWVWRKSIGNFPDSGGFCGFAVYAQTIHEPFDMASPVRASFSRTPALPRTQRGASVNEWARVFVDGW